MSAGTVRVDLGERSYDILIGSGIAGEGVGRVRRLVGARAQRAFAVIDAGVPESQREPIIAGLSDSGFTVSSTIVEPTEGGKSIMTWRWVLGELAATGHGRGEPVAAIGGGIVGDMSGFAAATYKRGVPVIQVPTTLLSMVDASVGGKTGVNLRVSGDDGTDALMKNLVGAFHQPRLVIADVTMLDSLDERVYRSGLGECVKHGLIDGGPLFGWIETHADAICARDHGTLIELVQRNVRIKAGVVAGDERESGRRMLLNLGHTFAHAIETLEGVTGHGHAGCANEDGSTAGLQHGEAVAVGLVAACASGESLGLVDGSLQLRVESLLGRLGLPVRVGGLPGDAALLGRMSHDKKAAGGKLRLVVPDGNGSCRVVDNPPGSSVAAGWAAVRG